MAEVLSQSQIDALLSAARSGEMDLSSSKDERQEKKYRKYDFYSPRKFTKDRLKMLNGVFENYTRILSSRINGLLHSTCEIEVESVEEQRYYEFSNALSEGDVLAQADVLIDEVRETEESLVLIHFSNTLMLSMLDRMMGGLGDVDPNIPTSYHLTNLELRLYENIVQDLVSVLGGSWENYIALNFAYRRTETNPTLVQIMGLDETVIIVSINLEFSNSSGRMNICLPGTVLNNEYPAGLRTGDHSGAGKDHAEAAGHLLSECGGRD